MRNAFCVAAAIAIVAVSAVTCAASDKEGIAAVKKSLDAAVVTVSYYLQYSDGEAPGSGPGRPATDAITDERPLVAPGYLVEQDTVLTHDYMLESRFVKRIEVAFAGKTYLALPDRFSVNSDGLFLKTETPVVGAKPLVFDKKARGPYLAATVFQDEGRWSTYVGAFGEGEYADESGSRYIKASRSSIVVTPRGVAVGVAMADKLPAGDAWKGSPLEWPVISAKEYDGKIEAVKKSAAAGLVQVTINFRLQQSRRAQLDGYEYQDAAGESEVDAVGLVYAPGKVLILDELNRRNTARIESMTLTLGDKTLPLKLEGALSRYGALVATYEGDLPGVQPAILAGDGDDAIGRLLVGDKLSYDKGARDEKLARARINGRGIGFEGLVWPATAKGAEDHFLYSLDGKLVALPVEKRETIKMAEHEYADYSARGALLMPASRLAALLADPAHSVDADYKLLSEQEAKRFVWLGVETQELGHDLAKAKGAAIVTKGGQIGALVTYVYKGSPAEKAGVKPGDILVRLMIPGQIQPVDVQMAEGRDFEFPWAKLDQVPDVYFDRIPRPWPNQNNGIARVLTEVGAGKTVSALFVSEGKERNLDFTLEMAPADFATADSYESKDAGLTVKDTTYEVRRYFKMDEKDPGVVAAEIEPGSKTSVAGVKPCEIITAVNGQPVSCVADFKNAICQGGDVSLTVKRMSQSRVAKMSLPSPTPKIMKLDNPVPAIDSSATVATPAAVTPVTTPAAVTPVTTPVAKELDVETGAAAQ